MGDAAKQTRAWEMLCARLDRDPHASEESDTCTLRAAWRAMLAFSDQEVARPTLLEALERLIHDVDDLMGHSEGVIGLHMNGDVAPWSELGEGGQSEPWLGEALSQARAAITLATGKDA